MRPSTGVFVLIILMGLSPSSVEGQKGKPGSTVVPVLAEFADPVAYDEYVHAGILGDEEPYTGKVDLKGGFTMDSTPRNILFDPEVFAGLDPDLAPSGMGTNVSIGGHNVGKVVPGTDLAGQFGLSWVDAGNGKAYRLQFGDAYDDSIDYAYITCRVAADDDSSCREWVVSSYPTDATPTGEVTFRNTGPRARLSVTLRGGAKGVVTLGTVKVPFSLVITRVQQ